MSQRYSTDVRFSKQFGVLETISFWGEGVGMGLYIAATAAGQSVLAVLGVVFVCAAVIALLAHLGKPQRSWRAVRKFGNAWVSRGTLTIGLFLAFAAVAFVAGHISFLEPFGHLLTVAALVCSLLVIIYAGMLLRSMRAIRLWRSIFLPLSFAAHSLATGLISVWALAAFGASHIAWLTYGALLTLLLCAALSAAFILRAEESVGVRASLDRLFSGDLRVPFLWGAGICGFAIPVAVLAVSEFTIAGYARFLAVFAALCRLYGDFAYRNAIVRAGAYEPIVPSAPSELFKNAAAATK